MEVKDFIAKLKANGTAEDFCDLKVIQEEYAFICKKLDSKHRGQFALNILCMLCRNLDKEPNWKNKIDNKILIVMSIECARQAKGLTREESVKVLACLYHLHKHAILQKISSELVLQLSHLPFEVEEKNLLTDYQKTYWAIVVDRLTFIEKYKTMKADISKILPSLTQDISKVIAIYNSTQFYQDILLFLLKKLFYLFSDVSCIELEKTFEKIFECLMKSDFIKVTKDNCYKYFKIFNECVKVIIDNSVKNNFDNSVFAYFIKFGCTIFVNCTEIVTSIKNIYVNIFINIFVKKADVAILETNLNEAVNLFENNDQTTVIIMPYVNHILRLHLENSAEKMNEETFKERFPLSLQEIYFKIILLLMKKMGKTEQLLKCENCICKSGLHDSLRLGFSVRQFVTASIKNNINISTISELVFKTFELQNKILIILEQNNCSNIEKYEFKGQSNTHNLAILLDEKKYFDLSLKLFELYLKNELKSKDRIEPKSVTRGLYNKSICELDAKKFDCALKDAFLSLVLSFTDKGLRSEKYMSLVIDIKSKWPGDDSGHVICLSVVDACAGYMREPIYGCLKHISSNLDFIELLKHEYSMYKQLWPSTIPISGVWSSFIDLLNETHDWLIVESEDKVLLELSKIIFDSLNVIRTIHYEGFEKVVTELLNKLTNIKKGNVTFQIIYATLLVLKSEFKMAECSEQYEWKSVDKHKDPETILVTRNLAQEYESLQYCFESFTQWMAILPSVLKDDSQLEWIKTTLPVTQLNVHVLLQMGHLSYALQLSYICTQLALYVNNINIYALNVGILMYHTKCKCEPVESLFSAVSRHLPLLLRTGCPDMLLACVCESAIYFTTIGNKVLAANLLNFVIEHVAEHLNNDTNNFMMTVGRLLEAQQLLHDEGNNMSRLSAIQKHWFGKVTKTSWLQYTQRNLQAKHNGVSCTLQLTALCGGLYLWRRARSAVVVAGIMAASALSRLFLAITNVHKSDDTQVNLENRLKYILYSTNGNKLVKHQDPKIVKEKIQDNIMKVEAVETMMEARHLADRSPITIAAIPPFKEPHFMSHERKCQCYICSNPVNSIFALGIVKLETFMYFRNNEFEIAKNYFDGLFKMIAHVQTKINNFIAKLREKKFEDFVVDIVKDNLVSEFNKIHVEILIENAFFELAQFNKENADDIIVSIQEIINNNKNLDIYIKDSFSNLLATVYKIKEKAPEIKVSDEISLESEFDNLKLSPSNKIQKELQKTPENRPKYPPKNTDIVNIYTDDEIPKLNLKIKKLNLDSTSPEEKVTKLKKDKKQEFKIPVPKIVKPQPEIVTPRTTRSRPKVVVSQPSLDRQTINNFVTPKKSHVKMETPGFFTPVSKTDTEFSSFATPVNGDQFFTPVSNLKTYTSQKQIRNQIAKKIEGEFATPVVPKTDLPIKESNKSRKTNNVETGSLKTLRDKRNLRRATSPGKLVSEVKKTETKTVVKQSARTKVLPFSPEEDLTKKINLRLKKK